MTYSIYSFRYKKNFHLDKQKGMKSGITTLSSGEVLKKSLDGKKRK